MNFRQFLEGLYPDNTFILHIGRSVNIEHKPDEEDILDAPGHTSIKYTIQLFTSFKDGLKAFHDVMYETKSQYDKKNMPFSQTDKTLITTKNSVFEGIVHVSLAFNKNGKQNHIAWWNRSSPMVNFGVYLKDMPKVRAYLQMPSIKIPTAVHSYKKWKQDLEDNMTKTVIS